MFRNRGRRVIASASPASATVGKQTIQQTTTSGIIPSSSSSQSTSPSPEKMTNRQQHHHHKHQSLSSNLLTGEAMIFPQQQYPEHDRDSAIPRDEISVPSTSYGERVVYDDKEMPPQYTSPTTVESSTTSSNKSQNFESATNRIGNFNERQNHYDVADDDTENEGRTTDESNILLNRSHETNSGSAEEQQHQDSPSSDIGSTVSIMGSIIGDDNNTMEDYDNDRLLAVRRRMMQDVQEMQGVGTIDEVHNESKTCDDYNNDAEEVYTGSESENPDPIIHDDREMLNVSLECNADTDTSLLEDYPLNKDGLYQDEDRETICHDDDGNSDIGDEILESKYEAEMKNSTTDTNNHKWGSGSGTGSSSSTNDKQTRNTEQESQFRAAFRRSAQGMSNRLPMSTQLLSERLTPNRFQLASASSAIDKAATTASLLPQFARQCFSFEDTTIDDDTFFVMPRDQYLQHADGEGSDRGYYHHHPQTPSHKYYGLSGVASFATIDEGGASALFPSKTNPGLAPAGEPTSPFRVIRHAQTWNHHGQSPTGEESNSHHGAKGNVTSLYGNIRHASSFDNWSPKSGRRKSSEMARGEVPLAILGAERNSQTSEALERKVRNSAAS